MEKVTKFGLYNREINRLLEEAYNEGYKEGKKAGELLMDEK